MRAKVEAHGLFSTPARWISSRLAALFSFDEFAQALPRVFAHGFKLDVGAITAGEFWAVFLAQSANASVAPFFTDLTVLVALSAVETFTPRCPISMTSLPSQCEWSFMPTESKTALPCDWR